MTSGETAAIVAVVALVACAAFLAAAETALTNITRAQALALEEDRRRGATSLLKLLDHRERVINPVLLLVLACHIGAATIITLLLESRLGGSGIAIAVVIEVVLIFVFAEAAPKTYALQHPERSALIVAPIASVLAASLPVRLVARLLVGFSNVLLPGKGRAAGPTVTEDELLALADVAVESGEIESEERALIRSIIDFGDTVSREVMVPRPDMTVLDGDVSVGQAMEKVIEEGYSRIPVFDEGIDDIVGILYAKDLMRAAREGRAGATIRTIVRPAVFVPEQKKVAELMREMQAQKVHMAVVVDEYGGTAGLVTLEDLIEELVGEIADEYDVEDPLLEPMPNGDVRVNARMSLDELNEILHLDLPTGDWDTVGGLVFNTLGHVPKEGETVDIDGHRLRAERVAGRRIGRVRITMAEAS